MTKREAKRWACGTAAAILSSDLDVGVIPEDDPDEMVKTVAMRELIQELRRRGDD